MHYFTEVFFSVQTSLVLDTLMLFIYTKSVCQPDAEQVEYPIMAAFEESHSLYPSISYKPFSFI